MMRSHPRIKKISINLQYNSYNTGTKGHTAHYKYNERYYALPYDIINGQHVSSATSPRRSSSINLKQMQYIIVT